jgi:hypothetical protein
MPFDVDGVVMSSPSGTTLSMDSGATNWMKVDASGILTRPQTPYFRGHVTGQSSPYNASGASLKITAIENIGSCWNNTTGLFTCPVAGYYMVCMGAIAGSVGSGYLYARKNNANQHFTHFNHQSNWHFISLHCVMYANVGDYFSWHIENPSPATNGVYGGSNHAMYSIALMA